MLCLVSIFSYTFDATFSEELLLLVRSFSYTPDTASREEFLLLSLGCVCWGVSHTLLTPVLERSSSYTLHAVFSEDFLLHSWRRF